MIFFEEVAWDLFGFVTLKRETRFDFDFLCHFLIIPLDFFPPDFREGDSLRFDPGLFIEMSVLRKVFFLAIGFNL